MNKLNTFLKQKTLYKFVVSYVLILILPIFCFLVISDTIFVDKIYQQIFEKHQIGLQKNMDEVNEKIIDLHKISQQLYTYSEFDPSHIESNVYAFDKIVNILLTFSELYNYIDNIYYYNEGVPTYLYTNQGTFSEDYFFKYYNEQEANYETLPDFLGRTNEAHWMKREVIDRVKQIKESDKRLLQYIVPVPNHLGAHMIFDINTKLFEEIDEGNSYFINDDKEIIFSNETFDYEEFLPTEWALAQPITSYKEEFIIFTTTLEEGLGLSMVQLVPQSAFFEEIQEYRSNTRLILISFIIVGGIGAYGMGVYSYSPIYKLHDYTKHIMGDEKFGQDKGTEFDHIKVALDDIIKKQTELEYTYQVEYFFMTLISNQYPSKEVFEEEAKRLELEFTHSFWQCVLIHYTQPLAFKGIESLFGEPFKVYVMDYIEKHQLVLFVGQVEQDKEQLETELNDILQAYSHQIHIFVGGYCEKAYDLWRSYNQATLLESEGHDHSILFYSQIVEAAGEGRYPKLELASLYDAIIDKDSEAIATMTDLIIKRAKERKKDIYCFSGICLECLSLYDEALKEIGVEVTDETILMILSKESVYQATHWREVIEGLKKVQAYTLEHLETEKMIETESPVKVYIDQNYTNRDLYVGSVAEYFGMSTSNLSHKFKTQTGITISEYIIQVKLEYAKELLREEDLSVEEISDMLGYTHPSSFIRVFKKKMGVTPKKFREAPTLQDRK